MNGERQQAKESDTAMNGNGVQVAPDKSDRDAFWFSPSMQATSTKMTFVECRRTVHHPDKVPMPLSDSLNPLAERIRDEGGHSLVVLDDMRPLAKVGLELQCNQEGKGEGLWCKPFFDVRRPQNLQA